MSREPMLHDLKIHPGPFVEAKVGRKPFEVRRDDRGYQEGDQVLLREWDPLARAYTGEELGPVPIICITRGYGLLDGYVVLGLGYGLPTFTPQLLDLQAEVKALRANAARWGDFIAELGAVLDLPETADFMGAGYVEEDLLAAARRLVALTRPGAVGRLREALDLVRDAAGTFLLGSGAGAKDKAAQAAVKLTELVEGRV